MEDKMKKYIDTHRDEFDTESPSAHLWENIAQELPKKKRNKYRWLKIAAALAALFSTVWLIESLTKEENNPSLADQPTHLDVEPQEGLWGSMEGEMAEVEQYYLTQVKQKQKELVNYKVDEELLLEVELLKEEFEALQQEMGQAADPTKVLEAMIENYQLRLDLLKDILEEMRKEEINNERVYSDDQIL